MQKTLSWLGLIAISTTVAANQHLAPNKIQAENSQQVQQDIKMPANLPPELQNAQKWQAFKTLWQQLNTLAQPHDGTRAPDAHRYISVAPKEYHPYEPILLNGYTEREYYRALNPEQAQLLQTQLREIFSESSMSLEAQLLARLTELRIQEMSLPERIADSREKGEDGDILTSRMMPPALLTEVSPTLYLVNAIDRLQMRAQTLAELREKGSVSDKVYQRTLAALIRDAQQALFLDTLMTRDEGLSRRADLDRYAFQTEIAFDMPNVRFIRSQSPYLIGTIQPEDLMQSSFSPSHQKTDMQNLDAWESAAQRSFKRRLKALEKLQPVDTSLRISPEKTQQFLTALTQQLATIRAALVRLEPIIAELER